MNNVKNYFKICGIVMASIFKTCPNCGYIWPNRDDFLQDARVTIVGYQVNFESLKEGFFLFNHSCKTTLAIEVVSFVDLYDGPVFSEKATGTDTCPGHCLNKSTLSPCPAICECAFVREIIQIFKNRDKISQLKN